MVAVVSGLGRLQIIKKIIPQESKYAGEVVLGGGKHIFPPAKRIRYVFLHIVISWLSIILTIAGDGDLELCEP